MPSVILRSSLRTEGPCTHAARWAAAEHKLAERYFKAARHHLGHKSAAITLDRYGLLLVFCAGVRWAGTASHPARFAGTRGW